MRWPLYSLTHGSLLGAVPAECLAGYGKGAGLDAFKFIMAEHRLTQAGLWEIRTQGVVSEMRVGECTLNLWQVKAPAKRFQIGLEVFVD